MRSDNLAAESPFKATEFWRALNHEFDNWFEREGLNDVGAQALNRFFSGLEPSRALYYASWLLFQHLKGRDRFDILRRIAAPVSRESGLGYTFEGAYVSWDLLISIDTLYSIAEVDERILTDRVTVVDLGAGWGRMGYVLKTINRLATYVICDLPESLLVSSHYLPRHLPDVKMFTYDENRVIDSFSREQLLESPAVRFLGSHQLARFEANSIDFFINVASFQEMTPRQVTEYFHLVDSKVCGTLYVQEYWNGLEMGHTREMSNYESYPFCDHWKKCFARNVSFSDQYFEAAFTIGLVK